MAKKPGRMPKIGKDSPTSPHQITPKDVGELGRRQTPAEQKAAQGPTPKPL